MARDFFNFGDEDIEVRPFTKKRGQLEEGQIDGLWYSTTKTKLTIREGKREITVGVKYEKDFDFDELLAIAKVDLKARKPA